MEHQSDGDTNCNYKELVIALGDMEIRGRVETIHLQHCLDLPEY